ncbi:hypothetical protein ABT282_07125 [Streptomyces sp. NPDC000927]
MNGHRMVYRIIGYHEDGTPRRSQWDATHSDRCPCVGSEERDHH